MDAPEKSTTTVPSDRSKDVPDAGLRHLDHYKRLLPPWRYRLRQNLLPLIRWETPYLAAIQRRVRTPALDRYFAFTANLGTNMFFTLLLPLQFWFGAPALGKALVQILSAGVFMTSMIKDFYSLPRPLSPPLYRITMSGSTALEYGFPSTHSTNAVSVAVYSILLLRSPELVAAWGPTTRTALEALAYFYAFTIMFGRIYCGMHGFTDVTVGSLIGAVISLAVWYGGGPLDVWMYQSSWLALVLSTLFCIWLVWIHPEPADDCPCFDDSVVVAGVVIGVEIGTWTHGRIASDPWVGSAYEGIRPLVSSLTWPALVARLLLGFVTIFGWREVMKPALLRGLPHLYRLISRIGLTRRRRFFVQAPDYTSVPENSRIDTIFPDVKEFPRAVESIRNPTKRGRSVSIGPQSAADAYETLAYRERQRHESGGSTAEGLDKNNASKHGVREDVAVDEGSEMDVFSQVARSRVRYDVEIVTKLVVYTGIGLLASMLIPIFYELIGLGTNKFRVLE
jgi:membrane-associated phospholipid phosphatase